MSNNSMIGVPVQALSSLPSTVKPLNSLTLDYFTATVALASVLLASSLFKFVHGLKAVDFLPGLRVPFEPFSVLALVLPETWWNPSQSFPQRVLSLLIFLWIGLLFTWSWRKNRNVYNRCGCDTISIVPFISGIPTIHTRSIQVAKQIIVVGHRSGAFGKSDYLGRFFLFWGPNIVSAEGNLWRRHRRIATPAFNNETYTFVWDTSRMLYAEMMSIEGWNTKNVVEVPCVNVLTFKFSLIIIASVGFGVPFTWANPPAQQGEMSLQECMEIVTKTNLFAITAPPWAWKLPFPWIQRTRRAYDTVRAFMHAMVSTTRKNIQSEAEDIAAKRARDLFSLLVRASVDAGGKMALSDNELIGNVFSFLFAGHETTSQSLAATLAFLALDFDLQEELVAQVREVTHGRDDNTLFAADYGKLDKVLAAFYEAIRMFPSGVFLVREAKHDTVLDISDGDETRTVHVKKGTQVVVDMIGVQYNPRYFSEPDEYRPSRWYKQQTDGDAKDESEEYTAFSIGPRACVGRKFASTEGVCFLASLLRDWRVEPLLAIQPNGRVETVDEWRGRVFQAKIEITMGIKDVPLRFVRRT